MVVKTDPVAKYLTNIKELPPDYGKEEESRPREKVTSLEKKDANVLRRKEKPEEKISTTQDSSENSLQNEKSFSFDEISEEETKKKLPFSSREIILSVINLSSLIFLLIILYKLPVKAQELKTSIIEKIKNEGSISYEFIEVETGKEKADSLEKLFLEDEGVVEFVNKVESLKKENEAVKKVSFASQKAIKDKTENYGYPVIIEITGGWELIEKALIDIQNLPYLFRSVSIETDLDVETGMVEFKYGIILYVKDRLGQDR